jgi:hypothetical protein
LVQSIEFLNKHANSLAAWSDSPSANLALAWLAGGGRVQGGIR